MGHLHLLLDEMGLDKMGWHRRKCCMCHAYTMDVVFKIISPNFTPGLGQIQQ